MAIISTITDSRVRFTVKSGTTPEGKDIIKTRSYANLKPAAGDEAAYAFAETLAELQKHPLVGISRASQAALEEE